MMMISSCGCVCFSSASSSSVISSSHHHHHFLNHRNRNHHRNPNQKQQQQHSSSYSFHHQPPIKPLPFTNNKSIKCQHQQQQQQAQSSSSSSSSGGGGGGGDSSSSGVLVFQGVYGPWTLDSHDLTEVLLYRSGLVTAAASFVTAASTAFLPDNSLSDTIKNNIDIFYALGAGGLGLSLVLIHIYVSEIKRTLQALWALGIMGSLATYLTLAQPAGQHLVQYVVRDPAAVWFVGPLFASLTGLVFKEGLCYGKLEAGILTFVIPSLLLGHLSGLMDDGVKVALLGLWMALFVIFAGRKFTQPVKDDIGDKSVFIFKALPDEQKKALIEKLEQQKMGEGT